MGTASSLTWPDRSPGTRSRKRRPLPEDQTEGAARLSTALKQRFKNQTTINAGCSFLSANLSAHQDHLSSILPAPILHLTSELRIPVERPCRTDAHRRSPISAPNADRSIRFLQFDEIRVMRVLYRKGRWCRATWQECIHYRTAYRWCRSPPEDTDEAGNVELPAK